MYSVFVFMMKIQSTSIISLMKNFGLLCYIILATEKFRERSGDGANSGEIQIKNYISYLL
jgi:hypothetical protein